MQAEEALHAATREGSLSGSNGQGDERTGEPGDRVECGFRAIKAARSLSCRSAERQSCSSTARLAVRTFKTTQGREQM